MDLPILYQNEYFSLTTEILREKTRIKLFITSPYLYTSELPQTRPVLTKSVFSIFNAKCYNENKYSFRKEVKDTEVGHLFEHVLLEMLCDLKVATGIKNPTYSGFTDWNWKKDIRGTFLIEIDIGLEDEKIIKIALAETVEIVSKIFSSTEDNTALNTPIFPLALEVNYK